jgi:hypothetical protein
MRLPHAHVFDRLSIRAKLYLAFGAILALLAALPAAHTHWADGGHDACLWRLVAPNELAFAASALSA